MTTATAIEKIKKGPVELDDNSIYEGEWYQN